MSDTYLSLYLQLMKAIVLAESSNLFFYFLKIVPWQSAGMCQVGVAPFFPIQYCYFFTFSLYPYFRKFRFRIFFCKLNVYYIKGLVLWTSTTECSAVLIPYGREIFEHHMGIAPTEYYEIFWLTTNLYRLFQSRKPKMAGGSSCWSNCISI